MLHTRAHHSKLNSIGVDSAVNETAMTGPSNNKNYVNISPPPDGIFESALKLVMTEDSNFVQLEKNNCSNLQS